MQKAAHFVQKLIEIEESYDFVDKVINMETDDSYHEGGADASYVNQDQYQDQFDIGAVNFVSDRIKS